MRRPIMKGKLVARDNVILLQIKSYKNGIFKKTDRRQSLSPIRVGQPDNPGRLPWTPLGALCSPPYFTYRSKNSMVRCMAVLK